MDGGVAQLVERLLCKQEVVGSIPSASMVLVDVVGSALEQMWATMAPFNELGAGSNADAGCGAMGAVPDTALGWPLGWSGDG